MTFPDATFDLVLADNVFEHFTQPEAVMNEAYRVLRPGGGMRVPVFSPITGKYGLHLKHGLKLPRANGFLSERTIIRAIHRLAVVCNTKLTDIVWTGAAAYLKKTTDSGKRP